MRRCACRRATCAAVTLGLLAGILARAEEPPKDARASNAEVPSSQLRRDVERLRFHLKKLERTASVKPSVQTDAGLAAPMGGAASPPASAPLASAPSAPLPGFAGSGHLYHIGANNFFLDAADRLALSAEQHGRLRLIKERSALDQSEAQRKISIAEEQLWTLTADDRPDTTKIEAKVREIEKLRADRRLAFIRAVGDAALLLTDAQRTILVGAPQPAANPAAPDGGAIPAVPSNAAGSGAMGPM